MIAALVGAATVLGCTAVYLALAVRFHEAFEQDRWLSDLDRRVAELRDIVDRMTAQIGTQLLPVFERMSEAFVGFGRAIAPLAEVLERIGKKP